MKYLKLTEDVMKVLDVLIDAALKFHGKNVLSVVDELKKLIESAETIEQK